MDKNFVRHFADLKANGVTKLAQDLTFHGKVQRVYFDEKGSYYVKNVINKQCVPAIVSSRLYNSVGIVTPPVFMLKSKEKQYTRTIEQEVTSINNLIYELAGSNVEFAKIETRAFGKSKWAIFYDEELIMAMLKFMDYECLDGLRDLFLADELRTDVDRHVLNYFFYRSPESEKYQGVVAIDLEQMAIYKYCGEKKGDFESFLYYPYQSATPQIVSDELCYLQRVRNVRELIDDGVLSPRNIQTLKGLLTYDFPKELKSVVKERGLKGIEKRCLVTPIERLWDYNQKTIGKDLGL